MQGSSPGPLLAGACQIADDLAGHAGIAKGQGFITDELEIFMPLAGYQQHVIMAKFGQGNADGFGAVADFACLRTGGDNIAANGVRCLGPRIVIGDKDQIGQFGGGGPHHRPFAGVTITTGTKQHGKAVAGLGAQRHQCGAQGVRRVGIVNDHTQAGRVPGNQLHAAFRAGDIGQRAKRVMQGKATGMRHNGSRHGIHRLKAAGQRNRHAHDRVSMRDGDVQPEFHRGDGLNMEIGTLCLANRQHNDLAAVIAAQLRGKTGPMRIVNIDNGGTARHQQIVEQPRFGSEIGAHIRVMVQMIVAEIGKAGDMHIHAVHTVLFQPVAAGFDRKMGNAGAGQ